MPKLKTIIFLRLQLTQKNGRRGANLNTIMLRYDKYILFWQLNELHGMNTACKRQN